ncbi:hypothetical protein M011DRAFT_494293 [Sporormia fimetaria CBS 119925]|uniref:Bromo domain-containing protein n=1 Tax=Sporormia fimetaria CBS 119925 TaxID=1340428 RepID=A0A6A6VCS5_9PLEO|nr:hypothetical protein M011DRAFT_494293 [Sporormia fimetaria CBS 119925]
MASRAKRKLDDFDPNKSDSDDLDFDGRERAAPQRRRRTNRATPAKQKGSKRQRREYRGSDVDDDDDEIVTDDSFTDRSSSEEIEINPTTGRSVRRAAKKAIKYEESDEDAIEDTPDEEDESPPPRNRRGRQAASEQPAKPSLIVKLKMPRDTHADTHATRGLRNRAAGKTTAKTTTRGRTPDVGPPTRRSSRLSHDVEAPIVELSGSGKHVNIIREGTRSPEPVIARATRGGKGPRNEQPSIIMEASHEASMAREEDTPGPLDDILGTNKPQVEASREGSPEHEAQVLKEDVGDEDEMEGVVPESQQEAAAEDSEDEGPVTRGSRNLRSRDKTAKQKRNTDESSDFEPGPEDDKEEEMSESDHRKGTRYSSEESGSAGRRSARIRAKTRQSQRGRRRSDSSDQESFLDADELAEEAQELAANKRRRLSRRKPDNDLAYDAAPKLRNRSRNNVDYRLIRPEQNTLFDDDDAGPPTERSRPRGGRSTYRALFSNQGPFGGGFEAGMGGGAVGGIDSDSSDDEIQKTPRVPGGAVGMTPLTATAPGFGLPQTHNADAKQATGPGGGPANFGKVQDRKALADADPLGVDPNVNFDGVGGLDDHINKLKEMVMLPLLYPEVFQRFKITPPRGVLFHGPPGTGKTLLARALASSVSAQGQKVTFYMRKGADALSKWVGEAERQLRLLKQEQIHASIVATLLALMDGMDGRGQVIVIGATNRPDSVDPALRRPGRFDRERSIIDIHTKNWDPPLQPDMKNQLAELTKGYGGADLRALCTEAALNAVQGTFPQIYQSERKLLIDPANIKVLAKDFMVSINRMVPSSQRTVASTAAPLPKHIEPLLRKPLDELLKQINEFIPRRKKLSALEEAEYDDREDEKGFERETILRNFESSRVFRPRLLINGLQGMGQQYLGAALLGKIEGLHVQSFDLPTILEDPARTPEAAITQLFTEVRRHKPSVIYIPYVDVWYQTLPPSAIKTFKLLLRTIGANEPVLVLGMLERADKKEPPDPQMMMDLFSFSKLNIYQLERPDQAARAEFFTNISRYIRMSPADFPDPDNRKKRTLPQLEYAPIVEPVVDPRELAARERAQKKQDRLTLNKLKIMIQPVMNELKKHYRKFFKPIIDESLYAYLLEEEDPNHFTTDLAPEQQQEQGVRRPFERGKDSKGVDVLIHVDSGNRYYNLDLNNIEKRLSNGYYKRPKDFLADIKTLAKDARTLGDPERTLKSNEMAAGVEVDMHTICSSCPGLEEECEAVYKRELEREQKAKEKLEKAATERQRAEAAAPTAVQPSATTTEPTGPIILGEPVPGQQTIPPVTPVRAPGSLSNGTSTNDSGAAQENGSIVPSRPNDDAPMTESPDLNTQQNFHTPFRPGSQTQPQTQTQKSQMSARTFMAPGSHPADYHNSASTTTSGHKTSDRSSGARFNTQSTNGITPGRGPDFSNMIIQPGSQALPDTQTQDISSLLNDEDMRPPVILDEHQLVMLQHLLVSNTTGCSVEQLEQINAALMESIWRHKEEYNRNQVIHHVQDAFNAVIADIDAMQRILSMSREMEAATRAQSIDR